MANSIIKHLLPLFFIQFLIPTSLSSSQSFKPKALLIPVTKDPSTLQYLTQIHQRTPLITINLVIDLGGQFLWLTCDHNYTSSTYKPARCHSSQCSLAGATACGNCFSPPSPGCNNNTCSLTPDNPITHTSTSGELSQDLISLQSTNGFNPTQNVTVSGFLFSCAPSFLLKGLAAGVSGMAGLGRTKIAFPSQLASAFSFHKIFAVCLASNGSNGVVFFGDGPYVFLPNVDASKSLTFTPLFTNRVSTASAEYFIGVKSIKIDNKTVPLNASLLSIDKNGVGGTKISTVNPYSVLEESIFKSVVKGFVEACGARNITRVGSVTPFEACFSKKNVLSTRLGWGVPTIEFVLQNESVVWSVFGANSVVDVSNEVICLGFVNGGKHPMTSIVIGGYQLENNFLQFDLEASRLGFSSLLFGRQTTCANFNFTSTV
ncbi:basic 7S globulin-like [Abrus precatorius]|uniref:Basic 7S globulin-like n=1 Tax=Abrus precatorius TaxID=3816 RepID=A0A8B8L441_ABRPR|nr:basic 7S globulin-like [Abrus precatorius]